MRSNQFEIFSTSVSQLIKAVQCLKSRKKAEYGLKGTTALCLTQILHSKEGLTASELAHQGEIDKAQVSRCMQELTGKGFIYRDEEGARRYKQRYHLTESGRAVAKDIDHTATRIQFAVGKNITPDELEQFYRTLYKLCTNFSELLEEEK